MLSFFNDLGPVTIPDDMSQQEVKCVGQVFAITIIIIIFVIIIVVW